MLAVISDCKSKVWSHTSLRQTDALIDFACFSDQIAERSESGLAYLQLTTPIDVGAVTDIPATHFSRDSVVCQLHDPRSAIRQSLAALQPAPRTPLYVLAHIQTMSESRTARPDPGNDAGDGRQPADTPDPPQCAWIVLPGSRAAHPAACSTRHRICELEYAPRAWRVAAPMPAVVQPARQPLFGSCSGRCWSFRATARLKRWPLAQLALRGRRCVQPQANRRQ